MTDIVDRRTRSRMMSGIRGRNTKPELVVRSWLHRQGFRFRLHAKDLPGSPDIVLPKWGAVVFVHGCFWHRHPGCRFAYTPRTNRAFWQKKFGQNIARDRKRVKELRHLGWHVITVWECQLDEQHLGRLVRIIRA